MSFIKDDYEIPQAPSKYMKFEEGKGESGKNVFRILGSFEDGTAIMGYEYWVDAVNEEGKEVRKPVRVRMDEKIETSDLPIDDKTGEMVIPKHFWALPVYNYKAKCIQILEITQKTIYRKILEFARNPKWGDPKGYDIIVYRDDSLPGTQCYSVDHDPKESLSAEIKEALKTWKCDITALYRGEDPFAVAKDDEIDIKDIEI
jgi:hypothetical protein